MLILQPLKNRELFSFTSYTEHVLCYDVTSVHKNVYKTRDLTSYSVPEGAMKLSSSQTSPPQLSLLQLTLQTFMAALKSSAICPFILHCLIVA